MAISTVKLPTNIRQQTEETSTLDCFSQLALVLCCSASPLAGNDAGMRVDKLLEQVHVLVINILYVVFGKIAFHVCELYEFNRIMQMDRKFVFIRTFDLIRIIRFC